MRARCRRADTYRAAPAAFTSSSETSTWGTAIAPSVAASPRTNTSSSKENAATSASVLASRLGPSRDGELRPQLQEALLADSLHVHQFLDLFERAVLRAVLDDPRGYLGANSWQVLQF